MVNGIILRDGDSVLDYRKIYFTRGFYENDVK